MMELFPALQRKLSGAVGIPNLEQVYVFEPGHLVLRRTRAIRKLEPRRDGPYEVRATSGQLR